MNRILITGALGHIGSRLIHSLQSGEFSRVILQDNLSTQRYCSLFNLPRGISFKFVEGDVTKELLDPLVSNVDCVIHLAAITNAEGSFENQEKVEQVNFYGTKLVAETCAKYGCPLLFVSTTSVYGISKGEVDEACPDECLRPQSPYASSKLKAERLLASMGQTGSLQYIIARFGTIYGSSIGMRFHTAVNKFIWQACTGHPLTVWRTALNQKRPYLDLTDAVRAIKFIIENKEFNNKVFNVLTNNVTVQEIIEVIRIYLSKVEVRLVDSPIMNQLSYTVSCEKFKALGFSFEGSLETGIGETVSLLRGFALDSNLGLSKRL